MITNPLNLIVGAVILFSAAVFAGLSIPLMKRKVGMNRIYGIRFKKSFSSDKAWYDINEYGGRVLTLSSLPLFVAGILCLFIDLEARPAVAVLLAMLPAFIALAGAWITWRYAANYPAPSDS